MERREFLIGLGAAAAIISASQGFAQSRGAPGAEQMHAPKYKALAEFCSHSVAAGEDCLRHWLRYAVDERHEHGRLHQVDLRHGRRLWRSSISRGGQLTPYSDPR